MHAGLYFKGFKATGRAAVPDGPASCSLTADRPFESTVLLP
ncbi:hypothetical protein SAMN05421505_11167 [Sinosporangium album]|uniref:Uncharacterized protein n=1 Tax=Sinosporangium album TaxID=504805 RepID=A0A1G7ZK40_9ACTN|nr:hypothetical protein SAMN05421505_11167 [Sinosporangium album]